MTAATVSDKPVSRSAAEISTVAVQPVNLVRAVKSEWIKLRTLRSTFWTYGVAVVLWVGFSAMVAWSMTMVTEVSEGDDLTVSTGEGSLAEELTGNAAALSGQSIMMVQLVVVVLAVLVICGEYSTGMIRSTFSAIPQRLDAIWAKALVLSVVTFIVTFVGSLAAFYIQMPFLNSIGAPTSITDPHQFRIIVGAALYLTIAALLAFGLGTIIRNTAGGIAAAMGVLFVLPIITNFLPASWSENIFPWLPSSAGGQIVLMPSPEATLSNWQGIAVFFGYALVALAIGAALAKKRDA